MPKIHVLMQKEMIDPLKLTNCVVVVFDVLLATTTITSLLQHGAKRVIPVMNVEEAIAVSKSLPKDSFILAGELNGYAVENFVFPCPIELKLAGIEDKTVILSTTNGTVALSKSRQAPFVYAASLLNGTSVARYITQTETYQNHTIVLVCAGNSGQFSMEDFIGAGYFIKKLQENTNETLELTDSATLACHFYEQLNEDMLFQYFLSSQTGRLLHSLDYKQSIYYALQPDIYNVVPMLRKGNYDFLESM
ncbi:2-phosphosulfolactate phosphatase [Schinkia sp. CFF1]